MVCQPRQPAGLGRSHSKISYSPESVASFAKRFFRESLVWLPDAIPRRDGDAVSHHGLRGWAEMKSRTEAAIERRMIETGNLAVCLLQRSHHGPDW